MFVGGRRRRGGHRIGVSRQNVEDKHIWGEDELPRGKTIRVRDFDSTATKCFYLGMSGLCIECFFSKQKTL